MRAHTTNNWDSKSIEVSNFTRQRNQSAVVNLLVGTLGVVFALAGLVYWAAAIPGYILLGTAAAFGTHVYQESYKT